jgi:hypothetical protein
MATTYSRSAVRALTALVIVFASGSQARAGTFAGAPPTLAAPSVSIAHSTMAVTPYAEIPPSQVGTTANFATVSHEATATTFNAVTTNAVTAPSFANIGVGLSSPTIGQSFTGSFGTPQSPGDPSAEGAIGHEEVPGTPDMGAANSVSGSIANATGSPLVSVNSYSDGSAVRENQAIGPVNAIGPANAVGPERSLRYESYEYSSAVSDFGAGDLEKKPRVCVLPGNGQCALGIGFGGKQCFCRTPGGPVDGISR